MSLEIYCRLCAMKVESFINIYDEEGESINLATKIVQCLQIWPYPEDHLPKTVCTDCCSKVNLFFDFLQITSQSQLSLMEMFRNKQQEEKNVVNSTDGVLDGNDIDHDYDSDGGSRKESLQYTDLAVSDKVMSKRKPRTPIKRSSNNETEEIKIIEELKVPEEPFKLEGKRERKCKQIPKVHDDLKDLVEEGKKDDDIVEEEKEGDEPKLIGRAFDGYLWKCTDCAEQLDSLAELRRHHWNSHGQAPVFACMNCPKTYSRYRSFARHVKLHVEPKKFSCKICGKRFSQKTVLQSHATVHSEERPHSCPQCGKSFKQLSSLYLHSKLHLPDQAKFKYSCSYCPKKFTTNSILETHQKIHTGERNFVCEMCGKRFANKGGLDYHMLSHSEVRPYTCSVCNKGFKTLRLLTKHSTVHTGVKPHQCDVCGKQFRERGALKEHHRIHSGAMPYACEFCGKLFRFKGTLTIHRRQHTGERPYSCSDCRREFTNWANYNKHMKRRHRNGENNSVLVTRLSQDQVEEPPADPASTSTLVMHYEPADTTYKVVEEDMYRVTTNYMGYYIPPLQHTALQTRP